MAYAYAAQIFAMDSDSTQKLGTGTDRCDDTAHSDNT